MSESNLTFELGDNEDAVVWERPVAVPGAVLELRVMARVLQGLRGLAGEDWELCERVLGVDVIDEDSAVLLRERYAQLEREAGLRGEKWEGGGL
jgi:hypothetical protein